MNRISTNGFEAITTGTQKQNTNKSKSADVKKPIFDIDQKGGIIIDSFKGTKYFEQAKKFDKDGNKKLEYGELDKFLSKFDEFVIGNSFFSDYRVYYHEKNNKNGEEKRACFLKGGRTYASEQIVCTYKNGEPSTMNNCSKYGDNDFINFDLKYKHRTVRSRDNQVFNIKYDKALENKYKKQALKIYNMD